MEINTQKLVSWIILGAGLLGFIVPVSQNNFIIAIIVLTSSLIIWIGFSLIMEAKPDIKIFSFVIASAGLLASLSIFLYFGIEKVAFPRGAIVFHGEGIAKALAVILFTLIPIVILKTKTYPYTPNSFAPKPIIKEPKEEESSFIDDDIWEEATEEDLISGEYEEE